MSSLITRCPACSTMFKVVPDQLRVSDGWVRCGQCNEVFDANSNLQPRIEAASNSRSAPLVQDPWPEPPPPPLVASKPPIERVVALAPAHIQVEVPAETKASAPSTADALDAAHATTPEAAVIPLPDASFLDVSPGALDIEPEADKVVVAPRPTTLGEQRSSVLRGEKPRRVHKETAVQKAVEQPQHSFMAKDNVSATHNPWIRAVLWVVCLLLVVGLVIQVVVQERDRIAATEPSTLRVLEPLCAILACKISPLRQIESIIIDSSSFAKTRSDVYRLNFTLKNTTQTAIATPSMELTLTDMQDRAVARRVFVAAEFGRQNAMEPGTELTATLPVAVKPIAGSAKVSGYRLLSFYP